MTTPNAYCQSIVNRSRQLLIQNMQ